MKLFLLLLISVCLFPQSIVLAQQVDTIAVRSIKLWVDDTLIGQCWAWDVQLNGGVESNIILSDTVSAQFYLVLKESFDKLDSQAHKNEPQHYNWRQQIKERAQKIKPQGVDER